MGAVYHPSMRIISNFHDYYDGAMAYGHDARVVYDRVESVQPASVRLAKLLKGMPERSLHTWRPEGTRMVPFLVVVAGKAHLGFHRQPTTSVLSHDRVYGIEGVMATPGLVPSKSRKPRSEWMHGGERYNFNRKGVEEAYSALARTDFVEDCVALACPVLQVRYDREDRDVETVLNPCLKTLQFMPVMDPFALHQEIDMFVSGVLPDAGREMVDLSDVSRRDKAGFDGWSFKRHRDDPRRG